MNAPAILVITVQDSVFVSVLSFGMQSSLADFLYLFRRPWMLLRALLSMYLVMPIFVGIMITLFSLKPVVEIALVALACSPILPILPNRALRLGGERSFTLGLLSAVSLLSLIIIPFIFLVFSVGFHREVNFSALGIARTLVASVILPLIVGIVIRHFAARFCDRYAAAIGKLGLLLILVAFLPFIIGLLGAMGSLVGNGTILALIAFALAGVTAGHFLGGPENADRTVLALATASRHPAIAMALTSANFAGEEPKFAAAAILLYFIVSRIVVGPYRNWLETYEVEKERLIEA